MPPIGYHIRIRLQDNRVILQSDEQRRVLSRVVLHQGRLDGLLAFSLPDTHLHLEALCDQRAANRLSHRIETSLKQRLNLPIGFVTYPHEPIRDQRHLSNTLHYVLTQHERHGLEVLSFLEATNLPDLLGLRLIGRYTQDNEMRCLPRIRPATLVEWVGLKGLLPANGPLTALKEATLSATALSNLDARSQPVLEARRAMVEVVGDRLRIADLARHLGVTERTVYRLRHRPANHDLVRAIRLQLGMRQTLQGQRAHGSALRVEGRHRSQGGRSASQAHRACPSK